MAKRIHVDKWLFAATLVLVFIGLIMVFSASAVMAKERFDSPYTFVLRQLMWAVAGVIAMVIGDEGRLHALQASRRSSSRCSSITSPDAGGGLLTQTARTTRIAGSSSEHSHFSRPRWRSPRSFFFLRGSCIRG